RSVEFDVVSNPEFLREGTAVMDFTHPDRVVIGTESERARKIMEEVYHALRDETAFVFTNLESAELIKYASNAFLATKVTFINEIADLCEAAALMCKWWPKEWVWTRGLDRNSSVPDPVTAALVFPRIPGLWPGSPGTTGKGSRL